MVDIQIKIKAKHIMTDKPYQQYLFTYIFFFYIQQRSGLTVDCDIYSLDICVDVVNSCALICPCSLPGDRWDFQVLIIWCHVPYESSGTHNGRNWSGSFGVNDQVNSCGLDCYLHNVSVWPVGKYIFYIGAHIDGKKVTILVTLVIQLQIYVIFFSFLLKCDSAQYIHRIYFVLTKQRCSCNSGTEIKGSQQQWQEWQHILLCLATTLSGITDKMHTAPCVSKQVNFMICPILSLMFLYYFIQRLQIMVLQLTDMFLRKLRQ